MPDVNPRAGAFTSRALKAARHRIKRNRTTARLAKGCSCTNEGREGQGEMITINVF